MFLVWASGRDSLFLALLPATPSLAPSRLHTARALLAPDCVFALPAPCDVGSFLPVAVEFVLESWVVVWVIYTDRSVFWSYLWDAASFGSCCTTTFPVSP